MKRFLLVALVGLALNTYAQEIPFQGKLLEDGIPFTGTKDFVFSIDVDGNVWTETHTGVSVQDGLYSIVLGSITEIPDDLFTGTDSRSMDITVSGVALSAVTIYAPATPYSFSHTVTAGNDRATIIANQDGDQSGFAAIEGISETAASSTGVYGQGTGAGNNSGVYGYSSGTGKYNRGMLGYSQGAGNGDTGTAPGQGSINFGVEAIATGNSWNNSGLEARSSGPEGQWNFGVHGISTSGTGAAVENHGVAGRGYGPGINYGVLGDANSGVKNYGGYFETLDENAEVNTAVYAKTVPGNIGGGAGGHSVYGEIDITNSAETFASSIFGVIDGGPKGAGDYRGVQGQATVPGGATNMGVRAYAGGEGINYGIKATAVGGTENYAGWFDGDVVINGNLASNSEAVAFGKKDGGWDPGTNAGFIHLYGDTPGGTDNLRAALETSNDGSGDSWGTFSLSASVFNDPGCPNCPKSFVYMEPRRDQGGGDPSGWAGSIDTYGTNSPNVQIGAKGYQNHDLPEIIMYGNRPDGGGWFFNHATFGVEEDGSQQWGGLRLSANDGDLNIEMGAKSWEDPTIGAQRPYLTMQGSVNDNNLVWLEVSDLGSGVEGGTLNMGTTDNRNISMSADGVFASDLIGNSANITPTSVSMFDSNGNNSSVEGMRLQVNGANGGGVIELDGEQEGRLSIYDFAGASANIDVGDGQAQLSLNGNSTSNFRVGGKPWEDANQAYLALDGYDFDLIRMETQNPSGYEYGSLSLRSTDATNNHYLNAGFEGVASDQPTIRLDQNVDQVYASFSTTNGGELNISNNLTSTALRMYGGTDFGGGAVSHIALDGTGGNYVYMWGDGSISATGDISGDRIFNSGGEVTTSDQRLKKNILTLDNALTKTLQLRGVSYNWKDASKEQDLQIGVIAQEVEEVFPEFVEERPDGYKGVNYSQMVAVLIESIKELNAKIEALESENSELKAEVAQFESLQSQVDQLQAMMQNLMKSEQNVEEFQVTGQDQ